VALKVVALSNEAVYDLAIFEDGTLVYEGHRCVKLGGTIVRRLGPDEVAETRKLLSEFCTDFSRLNENELCEEANVLRVSCSDGTRIVAASDRCRRNEDQGARMAALASALLEKVDAAPWLGKPTERLACEPGAADLARREIEMLLTPRLAAAPGVAPQQPSRR
jgi:hypothetical protein